MSFLFSHTQFLKFSLSLDFFLALTFIKVLDWFSMMFSVSLSFPYVTLKSISTGDIFFMCYFNRIDQVKPSIDWFSCGFRLKNIILLTDVSNQNVFLWCLNWLYCTVPATLSFHPVFPYLVFPVFVFFPPPYRCSHTRFWLPLFLFLLHVFTLC